MQARQTSPSARPSLPPPTALYCPNRAQVRAGSLTAFALPSIVAGAPVPAARAVAMSSSVPAFANLERDK